MLHVLALNERNYCMALKENCITCFYEYLYCNNILFPVVWIKASAKGLKCKGNVCGGRTDLKLILMVGVSGRKMSELLGQSKAVLHMFRGDEVLCHLDTAVQVVDLEGGG